MNKKILIIIDAQYDFIEGGKLSVDGATKIMDNLVKYIRENGAIYDKILLTADWHPHTHCSFNENGGEWSEHCVQFTKGASIYQPIIDVLNEIKADYSIHTKGVDEDHEEYSVFKNEKSCDKIVNTCSLLKTTNIDIVGIALNYCVKDSAIDAKKNLPQANIHVLKEFCPSIGDPSAALSLLENNNIIVC